MRLRSGGEGCIGGLEVVIVDPAGRGCGPVVRFVCIPRWCFGDAFLAVVLVGCGVASIPSVGVVHVWVGFGW